jgi:hypothetical protein
VQIVGRVVAGAVVVEASLLERVVRIVAGAVHVVAESVQIAGRKIAVRHAGAIAVSEVVRRDSGS